MTPSQNGALLQDALYGRCSVRAYQPGKVDAPTIHTLLAAAIRAPTAMHQEPWRFLVIQDDDFLLRLSTRAKEFFAEEIHRLHLTEENQGLAAFSRPEFNIFYDAGTLIVICAPAALPLGAADCWLAAENLMLAAHGMGLGSCVIGSAVTALNSPEFKAELGLSAELTAIAPVIVGKPRGQTPPTERKAPEILLWR